MPIEFVEQDDLDEVEERLQIRIDQIETGGGGYPAPVGAWEDATGEVLWGFKGLRQWPDLGSGGEYKVSALVSGNSVTLEVYGKMGSAVTWPSESAWYFYLPEELQPIRRSVGNLTVYEEGKGTITGGNCRLVLQATATPPYYALCLFWSPLTPSAGYLTKNYPPGTWAKPGSWFLAQITYERSV